MGIHESPLSLPRAVTVRRVGISAYTARLQLTAVVALSFVLRSIAALGHPSPRYFPDEYIYASLARSIADGNGLQIRGGAAHFPALLEPLLSSPFWLSGDAATAYRLTLLWHALAMSLAAVPVFMLCRRLGLGERTAVAAGAFAVALPSLTWASYLTADAIAYPLALAAFCALIALLDRPSRWLQVLMPILCAGATLARVQYVVLPAVFVVAALVLERGRIVAVARRYPLTLAILFAPVVLIGAAGPAKILGYYSAVTGLGLDAGALARWGAVDVALLAVASGVVLVPGSGRRHRRGPRQAAYSGRSRFRGQLLPLRPRTPVRGCSLCQQRLRPLPGALPDGAHPAPCARLRPGRAAPLIVAARQLARRRGARALHCTRADLGVHDRRRQTRLAVPRGHLPAAAVDERHAPGR